MLREFIDFNICNILILTYAIYAIKQIAYISVEFNEMNLAIFSIDDHSFL